MSTKNNENPNVIQYLTEAEALFPREHSTMWTLLVVIEQSLIAPCAAHNSHQESASACVRQQVAGGPKTLLSRLRVTAGRKALSQATGHRLICFCWWMLDRHRSMHHRLKLLRALLNLAIATMSQAKRPTRWLPMDCTADTTPQSLGLQSRHGTFLITWSFGPNLRIHSFVSSTSSVLIISSSISMAITSTTTFLSPFPLTLVSIRLILS